MKSTSSDENTAVSNDRARPCKANTLVLSSSIIY